MSLDRLVNPPFPYLPPRRSDHVCGSYKQSSDGLYSSNEKYDSSEPFVNTSIAANVSTAFYDATFPSLVRDLPKLLRSEQEVAEGVKSSVSPRPSASSRFFVFRLFTARDPDAYKCYSPEEHAELDSYERSKVSCPAPPSLITRSHEPAAWVYSPKPLSTKPMLGKN